MNKAERKKKKCWSIALFFFFENEIKDSET